MNLQERQEKLDRIRALLDEAASEAHNLRDAMEGPNKMSRMWTKEVTAPLALALMFIDKLKTRARELGRI